MAAKKDSKNSGTIRGKIVGGYAGIFGIIALMTAILMLVIFYITTYERIDNTARNELSDLLAELPQDASDEELYEQIEGSMPGYVVRYDLYLSEETPVTDLESDNNEPSPSIGLEDSDRQYDDAEPDDYYTQENIAQEGGDTASRYTGYGESFPK